MSNLSSEISLMGKELVFHCVLLVSNQLTFEVVKVEESQWNISSEGKKPQSVRRRMKKKNTLSRSSKITMKRKKEEFVGVREMSCAMLGLPCLPGAKIITPSSIRMKRM